MNSPTRQCEELRPPAVVIDTGRHRALRSVRAPSLQREASRNVGKQVGTRGPFAKRTIEVEIGQCAA
jgi:hypothetical protein